MSQEPETSTPTTAELADDWTESLHCYDCGRAYSTDSWIEAVVTPEIWAKITPTGHEGGILCINCMGMRVARLGLKNVPVMLTAGPFAAARLRELAADIERLNQMLRETGYGQGQIDAYVAQCEDIDRLEGELEDCRANK